MCGCLFQTMLSYSAQPGKNVHDQNHNQHQIMMIMMISMSFQSDRLYIATRCYAALFSEDTSLWEKILISTQIDLSQPRCVFSLVNFLSKISMPNYCYKFFEILQFFDAHMYQKKRQNCKNLPTVSTSQC